MVDSRPGCWEKTEFSYSSYSVWETKNILTMEKATGAKALIFNFLIIFSFNYFYFLTYFYYFSLHHMICIDEHFLS